MVITDNGYNLNLTRQELLDIIRALDELRSMQKQFPDFRNGFCLNTQSRVNQIHHELKGNYD